jgi:hypothetical protein
VRADSKFWNAGGINVHAGLFSGLQVSAKSAETVVAGGIAFVTPPDYGPPATNGEVFVLAANEDKSWKDWNPGIPLPAVPNAKNRKLHLAGIALTVIGHLLLAVRPAVAGESSILSGRGFGEPFENAAEIWRIAIATAHRDIVQLQFITP